MKENMGSEDPDEVASAVDLFYMAGDATVEEIAAERGVSAAAMHRMIDEDEGSRKFKQGLDSEIHNRLEEIDEMSGGNGGKISLAKLAKDLGTTVEQVIDVLSDQEFEYWTELHLDKGVVEVLPGGYQNQ